MTRCPLCEREASREEIHRHLVADHPEGVRTWLEEGTGRMRYEVCCPFCDASHVHRVKPRGTDPAFLEEFAREIRLVAYDMLLCHIEAEHDAVAETDPAPPAAMPPLGPGGGRGRPGDGAVPLPPGMPAPVPGPFDRRPDQAGPDPGPVEVTTWNSPRQETP